MCVYMFVYIFINNTTLIVISKINLKILKHSTYNLSKYRLCSHLSLYVYMYMTDYIKKLTHYVCITGYLFFYLTREYTSLSITYYFLNYMYI